MSAMRTRASCLPTLASGDVAEGVIFDATAGADPADGFEPSGPAFALASMAIASSLSPPKITAEETPSARAWWKRQTRSVDSAAPAP